MSILQIRLPMDNPRYVYTTESLEMKCIADIFNAKSLSRQKVVKTTVLSKLDDGYNQRLIDGAKSTSSKCTGKFFFSNYVMGFFCLVFLVFVSFWSCSWVIWVEWIRNHKNHHQQELFPMTILDPIKINSSMKYCIPNLFKTTQLICKQFIEWIYVFTGSNQLFKYFLPVAIGWMSCVHR